MAIGQAATVTPADDVRCGSYRLLRRVAQGGMAEVFLAADAAGAPVAIKRLLPTLLDRPGYVEMFLDEARVTAQLHHPNVAETLDVGMDEGLPYLAMEYLDGEDLRTIAAALLARGRRMPLPCALHIAMAVAAGLHYAHDRRDSDGKPLEIVHRDVTPHNMLVSFAGDVKLLDFGIARTRLRSSRTRAGLIKGKIAYLSPEQCRSEPLDRRTDLFSLGIVLWELTLGRRLYVGPSDWAVVRRILDQPVPPPRAIDPAYPEAVEQIVMRLLAKDRERRYPTLEPFLADVRTLVAAEGWRWSPPLMASFMVDLFGTDRVRRGARLAGDDRTARWEARPASTTLRAAAPTPAQVPRPHRAPPQRWWRLARPQRRHWVQSALLVGALLLLVASLARSSLSARPVPAPPPPAPPGPPGYVVASPLPAATLSIPGGAARPPRSRPLLLLDPSLAPSRMPSLGGRLTARLPPPARPQVRIAPPPPDEQGRGQLHLATSPWCDVLVDGRAVGRTPLELELPAGDHVVELNSPDLGAPRTLHVHVRPGETVTKRLAFRR